MKTMSRLLAATMLVAGLAGAAHAKTFVYCSEGSPEGFDPAPYTAGTTFDALVTEQGKTATDVMLGDFTEANLPDRKLAEPAWVMTMQEAVFVGAMAQLGLLE